MPPVPKNTNEPNLLRRIADGDKIAFDILYQQHYHRIVWYLVLVYDVEEEDDLDDLMQELFTSVWEMRQILPAVNNFHSYVLIMAKNTLLHMKRRTKGRKKMHREFAASRETGYSYTDDPAMYRYLHTAAFRFIHSMPGNRGDALRLHVLHGLSYKQIADQLQLSTQMVSRHIIKARELLIVHLTAGSNWLPGLITIGAITMFNLKALLISLFTDDLNSCGSFSQWLL